LSGTRWSIDRLRKEVMKWDLWHLYQRIGGKLDVPEDVRKFGKGGDAGKGDSEDGSPFFIPLSHGEIRQVSLHQPLS
jgi:hypothetical protein